jgi:hypothetical protein
VSHDGSHEAAQVRADTPTSIPPMPSARRDQVYRGTPNLLTEAVLRHNIGWQDFRKAGPCFVVTRLGWLGAIRVVERFPLTEQGWESAWRALTNLDPAAAAAIAGRLAKRAASSSEAEALAALDAEALFVLRRVIFNGGSGHSGLAKGQAYDLRFLTDRIMIGPPSSVDAVVEVPYRDVETAEIGGPGQVGTGNMAALILGLGLLGALLGLLILGLLGLVLGAVVFGLIGAVIGSASTKIETIVRIRAGDAEFYFLNPYKRPDALRIEMSEALRVIDKARTSPAADKPAEQAPGSVSDQLSKLASLLQQDLITRDEFEHLKAKLISES